MGTLGFSRIVRDLQKVGLIDSTPRRCNRVRLEELVSEVVVTVTDHVYIHLKDIDRGDDIFFKQVFDLQVRPGGGPLVV